MTNSIQRIDTHHFVPSDHAGDLTRRTIQLEFNLPEWSNRPTIVAFAGSRSGSNPAYAQEAAHYGRLMDQNRYVLGYGGAPAETLGLMSKVSENVEYVIGVSPWLFADRNGRNSGLNSKAFNITTDDFYVRKVIMDLVAHRFLGLPGGYGSFEEIVEGIIFSGSHKKQVDLLSVDDYWAPTVNLFHVLKDVGLLDEKLMNSFTVSSNAEMAFSHAKDYFSRRYNPEDKPDSISEKRRPTQNLQEFLSSNPHYLTDAIFGFLGQEGRQAPRVGIVVSGNISPDVAKSSLKDLSLTRKFCELAEALGRDLAKQGAVLVQSGHEGGLRQIMAEAAAKEGGAVIRVQRNRGNQEQPLVIRREKDRALTLTVAREYEKAALFDLVSQNFGFLAGGPHTLDRVAEIVTRQQTGFGRHHWLLRDYQLSAETPRLPTFGYNPGGIWNSFDNQIRRFEQDGFISKEKDDRNLVQMVPDRNSLAGIILDHRAGDSNLLEDIASMPRAPVSTLRPGLPPALRGSEPT